LEWISADYLYNEKKERLEVLGDIILNLEYWDCECIENYIHSINEKYCDKCNTFAEDSPNSRENELKIFFRQD